MKKRNFTLSAVSISGFSLVEILVSMLVSVVFVFGLVQFFDAVHRSKNTQISKSQIQERGRIAAELMAQDIRMMDFWGCFNDLSQINLVVNQTHNKPEFDHLILNGKLPLRAVENAANLTLSGIDVVSGSDTISVLSSRSLPSSPRITAPIMNQLDDPIQLGGGSSISQGDSLLVTDCEHADLFTNTHSNTAEDGIIKHETGVLASGVENTSNMLSAVYKEGATLHEIYDVTYFIGQSGGNSSLYRTVNGKLYELVRGVSDFQILYGIDDNQDGSIDRYADGNSPDLNSALVVRVELKVQNDSGMLSRPFIFIAGIRNRNLN